jgi:hypothetical protein
MLSPLLILGSNIGWPGFSFGVKSPCGEIGLIILIQISGNSPFSFAYRAWLLYLRFKSTLGPGSCHGGVPLAFSWNLGAQSNSV